MNRDRDYLDHILECIAKLRRYTTDGKESFLRDELIQDAVIRNFEIIGEAAKKISEGTRSLDAEIPWKTMAGFRDVLIHGYEGVDARLVWNAVEDLLGNLEGRLKAVREALG